MSVRSSLKQSTMADLRLDEARLDSTSRAARCRRRVAELGCPSAKSWCYALALVALFSCGGVFVNLERQLYPDQAMWIDNLCPLNDIWRDQHVAEKGKLAASARERFLKHHPLLNNPLLWTVEGLIYGYKSLLAPGPLELDTDLVVLVGSHHKTGSVLAKKVFAAACLELRQCAHFHVTAGSKRDVQGSLATPAVRLVSHPQWPWLPSQLVPPSRPYKFIHFWRHPLPKLSSGYLYHKSGVEAWTSQFTFRAEDVCKARRLSLCDYLKVCRQCCVEAVSQADPNPAADAAKTGWWLQHASQAMRARAAPLAAPLALTSVQLTEPPLTGEEARSEARMVRSSVERSRTFLCGRMQTLPSEGSSLAAAHRSLSLDDGLLLEAAVQWFENFRMAQIVDRTLRDPRSLQVELGDLMAHFPSVVKQIVRFLGTEDGGGVAAAAAGDAAARAAVSEWASKSKGHKSKDEEGGLSKGEDKGQEAAVAAAAKAAAAQKVSVKARADAVRSSERGQEAWRSLVNGASGRLEDASLTYDMGRSQGVSGLYNALYNSPIYQHSTGGSEKEAAASALEALMCSHKGLQEVYAPVFDLLGPLAKRPDCKGARRLQDRSLGDPNSTNYERR